MQPIETSFIQPGMSKQDLLGALGDPGTSSVESNKEVLQYCQTGWDSDRYVTIFLDNGVVQNFTEADLREPVVNCEKGFKTVTWREVNGEKIPVFSKPNGVLYILGRAFLAGASNSGQMMQRIDDQNAAMGVYTNYANRNEPNRPMFQSNSNSSQSSGVGGNGIVCFKKGELKSGFNKFCQYECGLSPYVQTIKSHELCPLSVTQ